MKRFFPIALALLLTISTLGCVGHVKLAAKAEARGCYFIKEGGPPPRVASAPAGRKV